MKASILLSSKLYSEEKGLSGSPPTSLHLCFRVQAQFDNNLFGRDASLCNHCCFPPLLPFLSCSANTCVCMEHLQNSARWKLYIHAVHVYIQTYIYMFMHICKCICIYIYAYICTHVRHLTLVFPIWMSSLFCFTAWQWKHWLQHCSGTGTLLQIVNRIQPCHSCGNKPGYPYLGYGHVSCLQKH